MNNSFFGKTVKILGTTKAWSYCKIEKDIPIMWWSQTLKLSGYPTLFGKKLIMRKTEVKVNKTVYLGQKILGLIKTLMYETHYDYMHPKYGSKVILCYMDMFYVWDKERRFLQRHCKRYKRIIKEGW